MGTILVIAEQHEGKLRSASFNAISFARRLAEVSGADQVIALLLGSGIADAANLLATYPVDKVLSVDQAALASYMAENHAAVVAETAKQVAAEHVCATATSTGKDLMPRVAALLEAGMASDVSEVVEARKFKRPMVAGNVTATVEVLTPIVVATARQTEWPAAEPAGDNAPVETIEGVTPDALGVEVVGIEQVKSERPDLTEARIVVSGGRGMKSSENFKQIEELADVLGAAMGATRAACDAGMVPNDLQVGQTGKVVAPDLYVAIALSGAIQHLAGIKGSKVIVAVNKDPEAPIFQLADYGLVAKWEDVLPDLTAKLRALVTS